MSKEIGGVFVAIAGILVASLGFTDGCSNEIVAKLVPFIGSIPGLGLTYFARLSKGDVNALGAKR